MPELVLSVKKLKTKLNDPVEYFLPIGEDQIALNDLIGQTLSLKFLNEIFCIQCERKTAKSFQQGYCYPCYRKLLDCNLCIIHPEKCNYPHHDCPDTWEHEHCKQEHIIYLANSSGLKVGITRITQIPTRWIDQGASQAIPLFKVRNRNHSGKVEVLFKQYIADKTNWRKMLEKAPETLDLLTIKNDLLEKVSQELAVLFPEASDIEVINHPMVNITYPIQIHPTQLKALTFDKELQIAGKLLGIKGQYLIFDHGVLNIRKHAGYKIGFVF